jgi:hypothetical protein
MWPIRKINVEAVKILYDYMVQFEYVARIDLTTDRLYAHGMKDYGVVSYLDLISSMPGSPYHMSLQPGIWRKKHLVSTMQRGWSAHELETQGTPVLSHNRDVIVLGTKNWIYRHIHAIRFLDHQKLLTDDLNTDDAKAMRELGYGANGKLFVDTPDRNINGEEVRQLVPEKFTCITCDQPMAELTEFEECPHWWRTWHDCSQRQCEYCHAVQKGEVVWEE